MEKRINLEAVALIIKIGMTKAYSDLEEKFEEWPEDPNGTLVTLEQVRMGLVQLEAFGMNLIENLVGQLPEVEIPIEPEEQPQENSIGETKYLGSRMKNGEYPPGFDWVHKFSTDEVVNGQPVWRLPKQFGMSSRPQQSMFSTTPYLNGDKSNFDGQFQMNHANESETDGGISWDAVNCILRGWISSNDGKRILYMSTQGNTLAGT